MLKGLKRFAAGGILLREVRAIRQELMALRAGLDRVAGALEASNAHQWPQLIQPNPALPPVTVSHVDTQEQLEWLDIEERLVASMGRLPSEEEMMAEWERRHATASGGDEGEART